MSVFKRATRKQSKLRLALLGPSGAGKTYTALAIASGLGRRIAVIDSERGSASLYAGDVCDFDVLELDTFSPRKYVDAINAAEREGYDVIIVDSLTHAWSGKDGALEMVDKAAKRSNSKNTYTAWRDVTPEHNSLVDALIGCRAHLISTIRVKTAYELQEDDRGRKSPVKIGLEPIQRAGLEYEYTLVADMDLQHNMVVTKTRCSAFDNAIINKPGAQFGQSLLAWLDSGEAQPERPFVGAQSMTSTSTMEKASTAVTQETGTTTTSTSTIHGAAAGATSSADDIAALMRDLPNIANREGLIVWARSLTGINARQQDKQAAWSAWGQRCKDCGVVPAEAAAEARKAA